MKKVKMIIAIIIFGIGGLVALDFWPKPKKRGPRHSTRTSHMM